MGFVTVKIKIGNPGIAGKRKEISLIVDTGAMYSIVPSDVLDKLGVKPIERRNFTMADGKKIEREVGGAVYEYNGRAGYAPVIFGRRGDKELLGVTALEAMGLQVDPIAGKLKPAELLLL